MGTSMTAGARALALLADVSAVARSLRKTIAVAPLASTQRTRAAARDPNAGRDRCRIGGSDAIWGPTCAATSAASKAPKPPEAARKRSPCHVCGSAPRASRDLLCRARDWPAKPGSELQRRDKKKGDRPKGAIFGKVSNAPHSLCGPPAENPESRPHPNVPKCTCFWGKAARDLHVRGPIGRCTLAVANASPRVHCNHFRRPFGGRYSGRIHGGIWGQTQL